MDSTLMSFPTCGHSVNSSSGNCTYCGAVVSVRGNEAQPDDPIAAEETVATRSAPPEQPAAMPWAAEMSEEADNVRPTAAKPPESILAPKGPAESVAAESVEPAGDAEPHAEAPATASDAEHENTLLLEEAQEAAAAAAAPPPPIDSNPEIAVTAAEEAEADPPAGSLMQEDFTPTEENARSGGSTHQAVEEPPEEDAKPEKAAAAPSAEALDLPVEEPDEAEALGAGIMAVIEGRVSEDEAKRPRAADAHSSEGIAAVAVRDHNTDDRQSNAVQESAPEKTGSLTSDAANETILLEPAAEVQISAAKAFGKAKGQIKMEAAKPKTAGKAISDAAAESANRPPDILKTENAASKTAAGIKKQKEKLAAVDSSENEKTETAKSQALKRQKAALAKAQAQKKQQLLLTKAAALKQKKATEAQAQATNKKRVAPAGEETPKIGDTAAASRQKGAPAAVAHALEAGSKLQDLLKKYKGKAIGINYDNSVEVREALLEKANNEYFSVFVKDKKLHYSYPLKSILAIIEGREGVDSGNSKQPQKFNAVIKVYPLVLF